MSLDFCHCHRCKRARREGKILGTRRMGFWTKNWFTGEPEYYQGPVSDYVLFPKFQKGRIRKVRNEDIFACE